MPSPTPASRSVPERSLTWPPQEAKEYKGMQGHPSTTPQIKITPDTVEDDFEDALERHPEDHFLSPIQMYEYEDFWDDDSDDDGEEVEWDAGITDFALFDNDRRRAQETNEPLPNKWSHMLSEQESALQRAVKRNRAESDPEPVNRPFLAAEDDVPSLTPDTSPNLRDDLDVESFYGQNSPRPSVPHYLTVTITPPENDDDRMINEEDDLPLSFYVSRNHMGSQTSRKLQRPGLRHSRTMSGRSHSWQRPGFNIYTVGEDPEAERTAELGMIRRVSSEVAIDGSGRR